MDVSSLDIAIATRAYPGELVSGDLVVVDHLAGRWRVALIDGLGHGVGAADAAASAREALQAHPDLPSDRALELCHQALKSTRGAAISIVCLDLAEGILKFAGVGNVEGRYSDGSLTRRLVPDRGIVGATFPRLHPFEARIDSDWLLLLHTDGLSNRFALPDGPAPGRDSLQPLTDELLARWGRQTDDATIVAIGPR